MRINIAPRLASLALLTLLAFGAVVTGCGGASISTICDDECACRTCTAADHQRCVDDGEQLQAGADKIGCSSEFDDLLSCAHDHASCTSSNEKECGAQITAFDTCARKK